MSRNHNAQSCLGGLASSLQRPASLPGERKKEICRKDATKCGQDARVP